MEVPNMFVDTWYLCGYQTPLLASGASGGTKHVYWCPVPLEGNQTRVFNNLTNKDIDYPQFPENNK
ncbi:15276_t:CDS:2 [Dentiscutata erythropus]|uniref:15276_t:CDS:1 n=1 Tax=Dentiscutata erythropus TaxID=1348616 RepID=A0A9N9AAB0_9GLOM|nr:15276_t:CDS:2 [Dentiscutata erythropus]